jgi:antitoxin YefM
MSVVRCSSTAAHIRPVIVSLLSVMHVSAYDFPMDAITFSTARATLAKTMDRVCEDHNPMVITRHGRTSVVMLSLEDCQALEQTADLLRSPANARRLLDAEQPLSAGGVGERDPIQPVL